MTEKFMVLKSDLDINSENAFISLEGKFDELRKAKKFAFKLMKLLSMVSDANWVYSGKNLKNKHMWVDLDSDSHRLVEITQMDEKDIAFHKSSYVYSYKPTGGVKSSSGTSYNYNVSSNGKAQPLDPFKKTDLKKDNTSMVGNFKSLVGTSHRQDDTEKYQQWLKDRAAFYNQAVHTSTKDEK